MDSPLKLSLPDYITLASQDHYFYSLVNNPAAAAFRDCGITTGRHRLRPEMWL